MTPKNKKGMMHISIVIFVMATLVLVITALVTFNLKKSGTDNTINSVIEIQKAYAEADIIGFYLRDTSSKSSSAESFKRLFVKLKDNQNNYILPEFSQIEKMIDSNHVIVEGNKIKVNFDINVSESSDLYRVTYLYKFRYERNLS